MSDKTQYFTKIKAFVFDVDGVLTDGGIYAINGDLIRKFESKDCLGLRMASMHGYCLGIISGGISQTIPQRFARCGMVADDVYLGSRIKMEELEDFCKRHSLNYDEVLYCGDDLPDIPPIRACGLGVCPADAVEDVKAAADIVSPLCGGKGFVRDIIEKVMRAQGTWILDNEMYKKKF